MGPLLVMAISRLVMSLVLIVMAQFDRLTTLCQIMTDYKRGDDRSKSVLWNVSTMCRQAMSCENFPITSDGGKLPENSTISPKFACIVREHFVLFIWKFVLFFSRRNIFLNIFWAQIFFVFVWTKKYDFFGRSFKSQYI